MLILTNMSKEAPQPQLFEDLPIQELQTQPFQPTLEGMEPLPIPETLLENCLVTAAPSFKKGKDSSLWQCSLLAASDLFNQDREEIVEASATTNADIAQKLHLKPGDRVSLRGYVQESTLELGSGKTREIKRISVSGISVIHRDKRVSMTRHEMDRLL